MLSILRSRGGEPVTYSELRSAGIEFPGSLVFELELADVEVERCHATGFGERPVPAVRLRSVGALDPGEPKREPRQITAASGWGEVRVYRRSLIGAVGAALARRSQAREGAPSDTPASPLLRRDRQRKWRRPGMRILAPLALLAAIAVVAAVILAGTTGANSHPRLSSQRGQAVRTHAHTRSVQPRTRAGHARSPRPTPTKPRKTKTASPQAPRLPATPVSPSRAATLEAQGHSLLTAGQSAAAVTILERAVASTGEHLSDCLVPTTANCLTYAYALFDLGRALQMAGHAAAAVAVLEQRLRIDNQRPEVAAELASARQG